MARIPLDATADLGGAVTHPYLSGGLIYK